MVGAPGGRTSSSPA